MARSEIVAELVPEWVARIGMPVWISGPDRTVAYMSERTQEMLGVEWQDVAGRHCYEVIASSDPSGQPFCSAECAILKLTRADQEIEPFKVQVKREAGDVQWMQVIVIPVEGADGSWPWLVHCAIDANRDHRIGEYLERIATRNGEGTGRDFPDPRKVLSKREQEVLDLLARDQDMAAVARVLHISRTTVRNHVQHILAKLGVHSIQEAVALHLL